MQVTPGDDACIYWLQRAEKQGSDIQYRQLQMLRHAANKHVPCRLIATRAIYCHGQNPIGKEMPCRGRVITETGHLRGYGTQIEDEKSRWKDTNGVLLAWYRQDSQQLRSHSSQEANIASC